MTTPASDMPDVIYAKGDYDYLRLEQGGNHVKYIRADKHTALERVAKEMAEALKPMKMISENLFFITL